MVASYTSANAACEPSTCHPATRNCDTVHGLKQGVRLLMFISCLNLEIDLLEESAGCMST